MEDLLTVKEASKWANEYTGKKVTTSNISYLVQYGRVKKYTIDKLTHVSLSELKKYYDENNISKEDKLKEKLGDDLNWVLSFDQYKESETTKHVHRLHPYKGKFIPQLVEYFLDNHTDKFKTDVFFNEGDIVLDPFSGSGTTMIQSCELGINSIGIDISEFNCLLGNSKVGKYDLKLLEKEINRITKLLTEYVSKSNILEFDNMLLTELNTFNSEHFPVPDYKYKVKNKLINEKEYALEKENLFIDKYLQLVAENNIDISKGESESFLDKWFIGNIRNELFYVKNLINEIDDINIKNILTVTLSRTVRSCRATTHSDLATLLEPVNKTYYCKKHGKICKPLFSILKWWKSYSKDLIKRLDEFDNLKKDTFNVCLHGDSRNINIIEQLHLYNNSFADLVSERKINGIFSSPPYVGVIDYHEQHAYAYDLFGFDRKDDLEIGPLYKGLGKEAKESYTQGIADVLTNARKYMIEDFNVFLVANDKFNLYPEIAKRANMKIVNQFKRPVLNRTEKDKNAYSEIIFHLKNN